MSKEQNWSLETIWNDTLAIKTRPIEKRTHIWSSEIGKHPYERYLKMMGNKPTKPLEDRVLRKFSAGIWFEDQIVYILKTMGILTMTNERVVINATDDMLEVSGKPDIVAGGISDWTKARIRVKKAEFSDFVEAVSMKLIDEFEKKYPGGLEEYIIEIKTVNSQVFWSKKDYLQEAYPHHVMQLYTYMKAMNKPKGRLMYISKDDLTIKEFEFNYPDKDLEKLWNDDVKLMTKYIKDGQEPEKPDNVIFDKRTKLRFQHNKVKHVIIGCWKDNWEVKWSPYLDIITGFKKEEDWLDSIKPEIKIKNEVIKDEFKANLEDK